jgi:hypothetical protein
MQFTNPTLDTQDTSDNLAYDPLISTSQLSRFLGCSTSYIEKLRAAGEGIPVVHIGKLCRYHMSDVMDFVERSKNPSGGGTQKGTSLA